MKDLTTSSQRRSSEVVHVAGSVVDISQRSRPKSMSWEGQLTAARVFVGGKYVTAPDGPCRDCGHDAGETEEGGLSYAIC